MQREPRPKRGGEVVVIDPRIAGLVSLRDELAAQVSAIDGVLAVLRPAS